MIDGLIIWSFIIITPQLFSFEISSRQIMASGFNTSFGTNHQYNHLNHSDKKTPPQYKKIFCAYHATEFLTNFCIERQCLMPLCPTCVVQHTEEHFQCQQKPTYVNLHEALQESKQKCYSNIIKLEEFTKKNLELSSFMQGLPDYIRKHMSQCKEKIYQLIDEQFDAYQNKLLDQIWEKYAEEGVYIRKQCDQVKQLIAAETEALYEKITELKGDQCLASLIRYYQSDEKHIQHELRSIAQHIEKNRKAGGIYISLKSQELSEKLNHLCEKVINLEYVQEEQSKSFNSTKQFDQLGHSRKGINNSLISRLNAGNANKSGVKEKSIGKIQPIINQSLSNSKKYSKNYSFTPNKYEHF